MMDRRDFTRSALGAVVAATHPALRRAVDAIGAGASRAMAAPPSAMQVVMLVYPGFTPLDLVGPHYTLQFLPDAQIHFVSGSRAPVVSEGGLPVTPTATYADVPAAPDILFVPGAGSGLLGALGDTALLNFLADRGASARFVTSVCTGSILLGAAGLLRGYRATSHWLLRDVLPDLGATPVVDRVVVDRNRITGAGVTAGIDLGLTLVDRIAGVELATDAALMGEYDPRPPVHAGTPELAGPAATTMMRHMHAAYVARARRGAIAGYHSRST